MFYFIIINYIYNSIEMYYIVSSGLRLFDPAIWANTK